MLGDRLQILMSYFDRLCGANLRLFVFRKQDISLCNLLPASLRSCLGLQQTKSASDSSSLPLALPGDPYLPAMPASGAPFSPKAAVSCLSIVVVIT